jgi:hypothetical protein
MFIAASAVAFCRRSYGRGGAPTPAVVGVVTLLQFFDDKVAGVRASTADAHLSTVVFKRSAGMSFV